MHEYTLNNHDRKKTYYILFLISGLLSALASYCIGLIYDSFNISVAAPSGIAIFFLTFLLFDLFIWKFKIFYNLGIIRIPYIAGTWDGIVSSSDTENSRVIFTIHQTYSRIKIRLETETKTSHSMSKMASLQMEDPTFFSLRYEYLAEYKPTPESDPLRHYGVTNIILKSNNDSFDDEQLATYYTESKRDTHGELKLVRKIEKS